MNWRHLRCTGKIHKDTRETPQNGYKTAWSVRNKRPGCWPGECYFEILTNSANTANGRMTTHRIMINWRTPVRIALEWELNSHSCAYLAQLL